MPDVVNHLTDGDRLLVYLQNRLALCPFQDLLKCPDQVNHIGGDFRVGALGVLEILQRGIRPDSGFDLLLLQQHLGCGFEFFVLQQAVD